MGLLVHKSGAHKYHFVPGPLQGSHAFRIKLLACLFAEIVECLPCRPGLLVGPLGRQGVEHICNSGNAPGYRNLRTLESQRISTPIPTLMVACCDFGGKTQEIAV